MAKTCQHARATDTNPENTMKESEARKRSKIDSGRKAVQLVATCCTVSERDRDAGDRGKSMDSQSERERDRERDDILTCLLFLTQIARVSAHWKKHFSTICQCHLKHE